MTANLQNQFGNTSWTDLCYAHEVPVGGGKYIEVGHRAIAVMRLEVKGGSEPTSPPFRVMDDHCPHAGGSLSAGHIVDDCVICPWHAWPFDVNSGKCPDAEAYQVKTYPVRVVDGKVQARLGG